jgi:hypothetical protein
MGGRESCGLIVYGRDNQYEKLGLSNDEGRYLRKTYEELKVLKYNSVSYEQLHKLLADKLNRVQTSVGDPISYSEVPVRV